MKKFFQVFANLKLAIFLLLLIAFFSGLGSIIYQYKSLGFYMKNYNTSFFGIPLRKYFISLELDHIYSAAWVFLLLFVFGLCLLSCTFSQQFPALKFARRYYFYSSPKQFSRLEYKLKASSVLKPQLAYRLNKEEYSLFQKKACFYGYKGLIGRIGPVIVHLSIICILIGSIFGAFQGFNAQEFVPKSEIFHIQNVVKAGNLANISQKAFRVNDFWVNYNSKGSVKQFQSDISVLSGEGCELSRKTISVNNPLLFKGLSLYQTDWGISGIRLQSSGKHFLIQLSVSNILEPSNKLWLSWLPSSFPNKSGVIILFNSARGTADLYYQNKILQNNISTGQNVILPDSSSLKLVEFISSTGVQIKADPGIKFIYLGFAFLIGSSFVSYVSFSEVWFLESTKDIFFGGQTNRAKVKFSLELLKLKKGFQEKTS